MSRCKERRIVAVSELCSIDTSNLFYGTARSLRCTHYTNTVAFLTLTTLILSLYFYRNMHFHTCKNFFPSDQILLSCKKI